MYTPNYNWQNSERALFERQQASGGVSFGGGSSSNNDNNNNNNGSNAFPQYVLIIIVVAVAVALACGLCARIQQRSRRRAVYENTVYANASANGVDANYASRGFMPNLSLQALGLGVGVRPPPRARRRPSQASITSLPVYMENPGEREVVLLQTVAPKVEEGAANQNGTAANGTANVATNTNTNVNANANGNDSVDGDIPARGSTSSPPPNPFQDSGLQRQQVQSNNPFRASIESSTTLEQGQDHSTTNQPRPISPLSSLPEGTEGTTRILTHEPGITSPSAVPLPPSPLSPRSPLPRSRQASQSAHSPQP